MRSILIFIALAFMLSGCGKQMQPTSTYKPPPGAAPTEEAVIDSGTMEPTVGHRDDQTGAEVMSSEDLGDELLLELRVPAEPDEVDRVYVTDPGGQNLSREAQIIENYETGNVGINVKVPKSDTGFQLKLIDHSDDDWPPFRQQ